MQKSKSWLKSLLIAVMAIVLVFSLVACNKDNNKDGPVVQESSADYFTALWNSTKPIGTAAIAENADLSVSFGLEISIDTYDDMDETIYKHQIDLGLDIQAVVGRTEATSGNTAVKVRLYDPTDANYKEILTLYAFADDLDNLYIDFAGKNIKFPHNLESNLFERGDAGKALANLLENKVEIGGEEKSINEIINLITDSFGSNWNLNALVDSILTLVGYDANKIIELLESTDFADTIALVLGANSLDELLDNGKLDILKILTADALSDLLPATKQRLASGVTVHKADLSGITALAIPMIPVVGSDISEMLGEGEVSLMFSEKSGAIQDFTIYAQLMGLQQEIDEHLIIPELSLKITDLSIKALASDKSNGIKIVKNNYSDTIAFDETLELAASGIQFKALNADADDIYLNGKIIVNAKGVLDIVNTNAVIADDTNSITENKTKANITVQLVNASDAPVTIAQLSYANGKIAGKFEDGILGAIKSEWADKTGFVYDLGADFNVADFVQGHIAALIESFFPSDETAVASAAPTRTLTQKIARVLSPDFGNALGILTTPNNHLHIEVANILQTVVNIKECVVPGGDEAWTEQNRIEAIVNSLLNPPYADKSIGECVDIIKEQLDIIQDDAFDFDDDEATEAVFTICKNAGLRILYIVAQNVRINGVATENLNASNYTAFKKNGTEAITAADTELMIYINNIKAVLAAEITFDGDLQGGIHASLSVNIAGATLSVSTSLELVENAQFVDLYQDYEADLEDAENPDKADAWVVITNDAE